MNCESGMATTRNAQWNSAAAIAVSLPLIATALAALRAELKGHTATLLTATHEIELSHAIVLRDLLGKIMRGATAGASSNDQFKE